MPFPTKTTYWFKLILLAIELKEILVFYFSVYEICIKEHLENDLFTILHIC